jgi:hypothetical protein
VRWFTRPAQSWPEGEQTVTVSVPVDHQHYWYGVLAIDFTVTAVRELLNEAVGVYEDGEFQLYDNQLTLLASSEKESAKINHFDERERAQIAFALQHDTEGGLRLGSRYLSWHHLDHFDGVLLRVHRLDEGMQGDFGRISVVLALLWLLSTAMLLGSWLVIRRMVSNMYSLQHTLQWQAWHDPMTRLHNRGALFDRAIKMAAACQKQQQPFFCVVLPESAGSHFIRMATDMGWFLRLRTDIADTDGRLPHRVLLGKAVSRQARHVYACRRKAVRQVGRPYAVRSG